VILAESRNGLPKSKSQTHSADSDRPERVNADSQLKSIPSKADCPTIQKKDLSIPNQSAFSSQNPTERPKCPFSSSPGKVAPDSHFSAIGQVS
jgi:hypothetical protein